MTDTRRTRELSRDPESLRRAVREFAGERLRPLADRTDEEARFNAEAFRDMAEMGLLGVIFPEEYGGMGGSYVLYAAAVEEIGRACASTGLSYAAHVSLGANPIKLFGTEEQKERYLAPLARGEYLGSWALTEPDAGSDAGGTKTTAEKADGGWVLNGSKKFITHGNLAGTVVVLAKGDPEAPGSKGITSFIVETNSQGFSVGKLEEKMGLRGSPTAELIFEDCFVPDENVTGEVGTGFRQALETLDGGRISIAALSVGIARAAFEDALAYAKKRRQFGKAIGEFQAIQHKIADMGTEIEAARALTMTACRAKDAGERTIRLSAMAKLFASEVALRACQQSFQIHGGYAFVKHYPAERYLRDVQLMTIGEGTSEIQRLVISRQYGIHENMGRED
jgi:alkylation response protein AidB-like acyl-CoA dehydrogenase